MANSSGLAVHHCIQTYKEIILKNGLDFNEVKTNLENLDMSSEKNSSVEFLLH